MTTNGVLGYGILLQRGNSDGPPETFTSIARITSIQKGGSKADQIDVSNMDSVNGFRNFIAGLRDGGEVSFTGNLLAPVDATTTSIQTDFDGGLTKNWRIQLPGANGRWAFSAFVTAFDRDYPLDKAQTFSGKLKIDGQPTWSTA